MTINKYASYTRAPKYTKQKLIELEKQQFNNQKLQYHTFNNGYKSEYQEKNGILQQHYEAIIPNRHLLNTPHNKNRIHILFKYTWNIF